MSFSLHSLTLTKSFKLSNWQQLFRHIFPEWLVVLVLILLGGLFRFANFPATLIWTNDSARDMSVAYLIAEKQLWPVVGHFNTGINGNYPPYYFYFLGWLAMINSSPGFIAGVNLLLHTLSLVFYYLIGKACLGKKFGWLILLAAIFSSNLIFTARYASPAAWNLSLYLISLWAILSWFKNAQVWKLILSLGLGLISLQIHGAQLGLVLLTLAIMLMDIIGRFKKSTGIKKLVLIWLGLTSLVAISQLPLIKAIFNHQSTAESWSIGSFWSMLSLAERNLVTNPVSFWLVKLFLIGLGLGLMIKFSFNLLIKQKLMIDLSLPNWWWFCLVYAGLFELALTFLSAGMLTHHQVYLLPCWLVLILGLAQNLSQKIWSTKKFELWAVVVIGLLLTKSIAVLDWSEVVTPGWYGRSQALVQEMAQAQLPIQTADVLQVDNNKTNLAGVSSSTKIWWFLMTELNRQNLHPLAWIFDKSVFQADELIIICDLIEAKDFETVCQPQIEAVLAKRFKPLKLVKTLVFETGFEVWLYKTLSPSDYSCVKSV